MGNEDSIAQQIFRGSSVTLIGQIIIGVSSFLLKIFLARDLSTAEFGLLFAVINFIGFMNVFSHLGMNPASKKFVSKFVAEDRWGMAKSSIIFSLLVITIASLVVSGAFIFASDFLATSYFGMPGKAVPVVIIMSIWFFFMSYYHLLKNILQGFKDFTGNIFGSVIRLLVPFIGVLIFIFFFDLSVELAALLYLVGPVLSTVFYYIRLRRHHSEVVVRAKGGLSFGLGEKMFLFGLPLIFSGVASSVIGQVDTMMLTALTPLEDVGAFEAAKITKTSLGFLGGGLATPIFPIVSGLWSKGDRMALKKMMNFMTKFSFILILPAALIFLAFPEIVIRVLYGSDYLSAANAMRALSLGAVFWSIETVLVGSLSGIGKTKLALMVNGFAAIFNVVANYLLIHLYGLTGAAIATGLTFFLAFLLAFYYSRREIGFFPDFSPLLKVFGGSFLTLLVIVIVKGILPLSVWPLLIVSMSAGAIFYLFWIFEIGVVKGKDLDTIEENTPVPKRIVSFFRKYFVG